MASQDSTDKQLAASVRFQRMIIVSSTEIPGSPLRGYVAGFDDETIFLAVPTTSIGGDGGLLRRVRKILIHRDSYSTIELEDQSSVSQQPQEIREQLEALIGKFRKRILESYFPNR